MIANGNVPDQQAWCTGKKINHHFIDFVEKVSNFSISDSKGVKNKIVQYPDEKALIVYSSKRICVAFFGLRFK